MIKKIKKYLTKAKSSTSGESSRSEILKSESERNIIFQEKIGKAAEELSSTVKEIRKTTRVGRLYLYMVIAIMIMVYVGFMGYSIYATGGIERWAEARLYPEADSRRHICGNEEFNVTLRGIGEVKYWKELYNLSCRFEVLE